MFGRNQSTNETGLIADLLLNFRPSTNIKNGVLDRPRGHRTAWTRRESPGTSNNGYFRKECSMISSIKPSPFWHKARFQVYFQHISQCKTRIGPTHLFQIKSWYLPILTDQIHGAFCPETFRGPESPDIYVWNRPKLNWKHFNALSKMTKKIKLMQSIYYLLIWKIKMIPDIKIGDY